MVAVEMPATVRIDDSPARLLPNGDLSRGASLASVCANDLHDRAWQSPSTKVSVSNSMKRGRDPFLACPRALPVQAAGSLIACRPAVQWDHGDSNPPREEHDAQQHQRQCQFAHQCLHLLVSELRHPSFSFVCAEIRAPHRGVISTPDDQVRVDGARQAASTDRRCSW